MRIASGGLVGRLVGSLFWGYIERVVLGGGGRIWEYWDLFSGIGITLIAEVLGESIFAGGLWYFFFY